MSVFPEQCSILLRSELRKDYRIYRYFRVLLTGCCVGRTGGKVNITSEKGEGTVIEAIFGYTHLDRPPLGDVAGTIGLLVMANPEIVFFIKSHRNSACPECF